MLLLRLLIVAGILIGVWLLFFRSRPGSSRSVPLGRFKCSGCRHAVRVDGDGAICRYGSKSTFKNWVHIENCADFER